MVMVSANSNVLLVKLVIPNISVRQSIFFIQRLALEGQLSTRNWTALSKKSFSRYHIQMMKLMDILPVHTSRWARTLAEVMLVCYTSESTRRCERQTRTDRFSRR